MNDNPNTPQYYRLLEKGEQLQSGDIYSNNGQSIVTVDPVYPGHLAGIGNRNCTYFRPVTVDEWIPYSERKPTREDLGATGTINVVFSDGSFGSHGAYSLDHLESNGAIWWRLVTPPQPAKPKSAECRVWNDRNNIVTAGLFRGALTLNPDGSGTLDCGDVIAADCLDEIFKARNSVMDKDL